MFYYFLSIKLWILSLFYSKDKLQKQIHFKDAMKECDCKRRKKSIKNDYKKFSTPVFKNRLEEIHAIKIEESE